MFVLDESGLRRKGVRWEQQQRYRVLEKVEGRYQVQTYLGSEPAAGEPINPMGRGNVVLTSIPFTVVGARDLSLAPELPPLMGVARAAFARAGIAASR